MLLLISAILLFSSSIFITSILKLKNKVAYALSIYLIFFSSVVLIAQLSGFIGLLSNKFVFIFLQLILLSGVLIIWWKRGKPPLLAPFTGIDIKSRLKYLIGSVKRYPVTSLFSIIIFAGYIILAWLIIRVPPNNSDSMHTHLARVMYWLQQNSFAQLTSFSIFAKIYPFNANLNILWTILFTGSDKFVGFVQYFSTIFCALAIFGISRLLGGSRRTSLIVGLLWMTFPLNVFQATTTQNDMVVTALFTSSLFFFFTFIKKREFSNLFLSGLALGAAFGTKETMFMMGLGIVIMLLMVVLKDKKLVKPILHWILIGITSFLLLGSFIYFNNLYYYQNPLGPSEHVLSDSFGNYSILEKLKFNAPRLIFQFISFDSLPVQIAKLGTNTRDEIFSKLFESINLPLESNNAIKEPGSSKSFSFNMAPTWNEDMSWFGPVSVLMLVPAFLVGLFFGIKRKDVLSLSLVIFGFTFFLFEIIFRPGWDPYQGRYFVLSTAILMPLSALLINKSIVSKIYTVMLYLIAFIVFFMAVFSNESKPILGTEIFINKFSKIEKTIEPQDSVYDLIIKKDQLKFFSFLTYNLPFQKSINNYDDVQLRTLSSLSQHEEILRLVNEYVPSNAKMGVILGGGTFDYIFFGPRLERILISINPISLLYDENWVKEKGLQYVLISNQGRIDSIPSYLDQIAAVDDWALYSVK